MTPLPKLSASKSKSEFLRYLGLQEHDDGHKRLYQQMMEEAAAGRARTCQNPENLTPQSRADPLLTPPYSSSMITETARHREVQNIYEHASPETRAIYERGMMQDGANWDNWIIRWCLWHVFRYRDDRNRNRGIASKQRRSQGGSDGGSGYDQDSAGAGGQYSYSSAPFYDPVRDL